MSNSKNLPKEFHSETPWSTSKQITKFDKSNLRQFVKTDEDTPDNTGIYGLWVMDTHSLVGNALSNYLSFQLLGLHAQTLKMCMWYENVLNEGHLGSAHGFKFFLTFYYRKSYQVHTNQKNKGDRSIDSHALQFSRETCWLVSLKKWIACISEAECPFK